MTSLAVRICPLVLCLASAVGCVDAERQEPEKPSPGECEELANTLVGLRMQTVTADRAQHEANLRAALGPAFVASCQASR